MGSREVEMFSGHRLCLTGQTWSDRQRRAASSGLPGGRDMKGLSMLNRAISIHHRGFLVDFPINPVIH